MPEIWLNYGATEVVLDIGAENLGQRVDSGGDVLDDAAVGERLGGLDLERPVEIAVLHDSASVRKAVSSLLEACGQRSPPPPKVLADRRIVGRLRAGLPEGADVGEFDDPALSNSRLVFVGEVEFDGLFGYETVSTRLIRRFGRESMLSAYARRKANAPAPGQATGSFEEARKFTDGFEIQAVEVVSNSSGIVDLAAGHPSQTSSLTGALESTAVRDVGRTGSMIISTGKEASNGSLAASLSSLWNCSLPVQKGGLAVLVAECGDGLGSDSLRQYVEGRLEPEQLRTPARYTGGMEDLLYLHEVQKGLQVGIVSVLPEFYTKKLGMVSLPGIRQSLDYVLKTQGPREKVAVVSDGARLLLR